MLPLFELLLNAVARLERTQALGAEEYERSEKRLGYANGYKDKSFQTTMGPVQLKIPQTRGIAFYPKSLGRSERALNLAIAEMYIKGVSTRKVQKITQELCGYEISSTQVSREAARLDEEFIAFRERIIGTMVYLFLDATYLKVRHDGSVIDMPCLVAYGVDPQGRRQVLGASMSLSEAEVHWREFLQSLQSRGLSGLQLIVSDDHPGLKSARRAVFPSVSWQRCQFHMAQNAQSYAPRQSMRGEIGQVMRDTFGASSLDAARQETLSVSTAFAKRAPEFVDWLDANIEEGLAVYGFPRAHWRRLRTTNGMERVNREIKRRVRVAVLFPHKESALRLVTGVLTEIHDEWITGRRHLDMSLLETENLDAEKAA